MGGAWYEWTAPASGWVALDTEGTDFPVMLSLGQPGATLPQAGLSLPLATWLGVPVVDLPPMPVERRLFEATAGTRYAIWVRTAGADPASLTVRLNIRPAHPPPALAHAALRAVADVGSLSGADWLEALVSVASPNGFVRGSVSALPAYDVAGFTDADLVSGDALAGIYRVLLPRKRHSSLQTSFSQPIFVALADAAGGQQGVDAAAQPALFTLPSLPTSASLETDTRAPLLSGITGLPASVTLSGADVVLDLQIGISDPGGSGFASGEIFLDQISDGTRSEGFLLLGGASLATPGPRRWPMMRFDASNRISGDTVLGVYAVSITLPKNLPAVPEGRLRYRLRDSSGNVTKGDPQYGGVLYGAVTLPVATGSVSSNVVNAPYIPDFRSLPFAIVQSGTADEAHPVITDAAATFAATPGEFGTISLSARLTDAGSGIAGGRVRLVDASGQVETEVAMTAAHRASGTVHDGQWQIELPVPPVGRGGRHFVRWLVWDASGLPSPQSLLGPLAPPDRALAGDARLPQLTAFEIAPHIADVTTAPASAQVVFNAGDDRPGLSARLLITTARGDILADRTWQSATSSLDVSETVTLPQITLTGEDAAARVYLDLTDSAGRRERYGPPGRRPFPTSAGAALVLAPTIAGTYTRWAADFLAPADAQPNEDADGDGIPNALEFALGLDPARHSGPRGADPMAPRAPRQDVWPDNPLALAMMGGVRQFRFAFAPSPMFQPGAGHALGHDGWSLVLECSTDLVNWTSVPMPEETTDGTRVLTTPAAGGAGSFFRLRVIAP